MPSKIQNQIYHARRRAKERYNLELTQDLHRLLVRKIQDQRGTYLGRRSKRTSVWEVTHLKQTYKVVYDKIRKVIVTFLPVKKHVQRYGKPKVGHAYWTGYFVDFGKKEK